MAIIDNKIKWFLVSAYSNGALGIYDFTEQKNAMPRFSVGDNAPGSVQSSRSSKTIYEGDDTNAGIESLKQVIQAVKE